MKKVAAVDGNGSPPLFENNEKVLCFHGPLIYEGKILKTEFKPEKNEFAYFVHYAGWNKSWDEWIFESRVLKYIDANLERQKELKQSHEEQAKANKKAGVAKVSLGGGKKKSNVGSDTISLHSASDSRSSTPIFDQKSGKSSRRDSLKADGDVEAASRKRKRNECIESESVFQMKQEVQITLPDELKELLLEDWDQVVRLHHVAKLPQEKCVNRILMDYLKTRKKTDMYAVELCNGLRDYFDLMLGNARFHSNLRNDKCSQLLYGDERDQYLQMQKICEESDPKKTMSDCYGFTHLLRLFTKLGVSLSYTDLDVEAVELLQVCIGELLKYLSKNRGEYFSIADYTAAAPESLQEMEA